MNSYFVEYRDDRRKMSRRHVGLMPWESTPKGYYKAETPQEVANIAAEDVAQFEKEIDDSKYKIETYRKKIKKHCVFLVSEDLGFNENKMMYETTEGEIYYAE